MFIRILTLTAVLALTALPSQMPAHAETAYSVKDIPLDDAGLRMLDQKHLHLARRAGTICVHMAPGGVVRHGSAPIALDGCNISQLDHLVAEQNDPALSAYHHAIRPGERYDQNRSALYWRTVRQQLLANNPELSQPAVK